MRSAVDEFNGLAVDDVVRELGQHARRTLFGRRDVVEFRPDEIEGAEQCKFQAFVVSVSPDYAVEHLFDARVNPAFFRHGAENEGRVVFVEILVGAHSVYFGSGGEDYAFVVLCAFLDDVDIRFVVEFVDAQGVFYVKGGGGDCDERNDDVAGFYLLFNPVFVGKNVFLEEAESFVFQAVLDFIRAQVHADDFPVGFLEDFPRERRAYKSVYAQYKYFLICHIVFL